jgi:beta-lactam-binding protein with PASTA domain/CHAT domain-containing protein
MMDSGSSSTNPWEYVDFELEIREDNQGGYSVSVLRSPGGEPQEEMRFPFGDKRNLKKKLEELEEALYYSSEETRSSSSTRRRSHSLDEQTVRDHSFDEQVVQEFGRGLFGVLLDGEVRASYRVSWHEAKQQNKGLRLKLRVQPPELAQLPWEFLYDPSLDQYLCLSYKRPLVRYLNLPQPVEPLGVKPPLRVLGMVANPSDPTLDELDVEREKRLVDEATKELQAKGLVELRWAEGETFDDLQEEMLHGTWHVFHFIGHGDFNPSREEGAIALSDEEGQKRLLGARNLANLLTDQFSLRLVFLNSCEGAKSREGDAFSSAATTLVRQGVPAVVAMQYEITDKAAITFARSFYRGIAAGLPVDAAVAVGRTSLSNKVGHTLEWATPVLYMRSPDGRVFDVSTEDRKDSRQQYREALELAWANGELTRSEADWLNELTDRLRLDASTAAEIEREVMNDTKEVLVERSSGDVMKTAKVPDLTGQGRSEASSTLAAVGLKLGDQNEASSDTAPEGKIIAQDPVARTEAERGSAVNITVSSGPQKVAVPDLTGQRFSQARNNLAEVSLKLGGKDETPSETVSKGAIIKQNPAAGTRVNKGDTVRVTVSSGPQQRSQEEYVAVPNLIGKSLTQARSELVNAGLKLGGRSKAQSDTAAEGEIIGQYPVVQTQVKRGSSVRVTVSSGPQQAADPGVSGRSKVARRLVAFIAVLVLVAFVVLILISYG